MSKKRLSSMASKKRRRLVEGSHQKIARDFLSNLDHTWRRHGGEILSRVRTEQPKLYFRAMVKLSEVLHRRLPEPPGFNRSQCRADVLQRLLERKGRTLR